MGTLDEAKLDIVSNRLGEAVLDPARWPDLMDDICGAVGTTGASLLQSDIRTPDIPMTTSVTELLTSYFKNNFHTNDVRAIKGAPLLLAGAPVICDQDLFASERDMMHDPLYSHISHLGFRWWAAVGFRSGSALWGLALQRTPKEGSFEIQEKQALARLSIRLTETATLSKAVGRLVLLGMTNALNHIRQPAIALDRLGFVIDTNAAAAEFFDEDVRVKDRRLILRDKSARSALEGLAIRMSVTRDTAALPPTSPIVVQRQVGHPFVIRVLPVDGAARSPFLGARAILTFSALRSRPNSEPDMLSQAFKLTAAEARLTSLIAMGTSIERAAEELGVARETARNQLKAVFAKTGVHRQSELVALLLRL